MSPTSLSTETGLPPCTLSLVSSSSHKCISVEGPQLQVTLAGSCGSQGCKDSLLLHLFCLNFQYQLLSWISFHPYKQSQVRYVSGVDHVDFKPDHSLQSFSAVKSP